MKTKGRTMKQTERSVAGRLRLALKYATKANDALVPLLEDTWTETSRDIHRADNATIRCIQELSAAIEALPVEGAYVRPTRPRGAQDPRDKNNGRRQ